MTEVLIKLSTPTIVKKPRYTGVKVLSLLKALKSRDIHKYLNITRKNRLSEIDNIYKTNGFIVYDEMWIIWKLYWNFVVNDYRDNV